MLLYNNLYNPRKSFCLITSNTTLLNTFNMRLETPNRMVFLRHVPLIGGFALDLNENVYSMIAKTIIHASLESKLYA